MSTILVTGARAPVALHWARLLGSSGHRVLLADSQRFPVARATRHAQGYHRLPPARRDVAAYGGAVAAIVRREAVDLVLPTCEEIFFLAAARDLHHFAIPLAAPPFARLAEVHDKHRFALLAARTGMAPAETIPLSSPQSLRDLGERATTMVLKPIWSRFGERVLIQPTAGQLAGLRPSPDDPWIAQSYLPGEELCAFALARDGHMLALQAYRPLYRAGKGAALAFEATRDPEIDQFVGELTAEIGWTGQISFDFRRDADGRLKVIECNPRATSGLHFFTQGDGLDEALLAGERARASGQGRMTLPLAMLAYGLPTALRSGSYAQWRQDFGAMADLSVYPGDRSLLPAQILSLGEIALTALLKGKGLKAAATDDIEWNGEPLGPSPASDA